MKRCTRIYSDVARLGLLKMEVGRMDEIFCMMKKFANNLIIAIFILSFLSPLVTPVMATIMNEGITQLTTDPGDQICFSWSPDGTKIAYLSFDGGSTYDLWVMNTDGTGKIKIDTIDSAGDSEMAFLLGWDFDWDPDSKTIVYTKYEGSDTGSIWAMNIETTEKKELAQKAMNPSWSPDGTKIVYASQESGQANLDVWVMDTDGNNKRKLASNAGFDELFPSWSPDGTKIVYVSWVESQKENANIWIINADGTNNIKLASNATLPKWSPDGTKIAYQSGWAIVNVHSVWTISPDGTENICILTNPNPIVFMYSKWSPDSTKITCLVGTEFGGDLLILNTDGSGKYWIIPNAMYCSWSPDGKNIVYSSYSESGPGDIYVINADGTQEKKLILNAGFPLWSPDGTKIAYTGGEESNQDVWVMRVAKEEITPTLTPTIIPAPTATVSPTATPEVTSEKTLSPEEKGVPGFETIFAISGLLAVAYIVKKKKEAL